MHLQSKLLEGPTVPTIVVFDDERLEAGWRDLAVDPGPAGGRNGVTVGVVVDPAHGEVADAVELVEHTPQHGEEEGGPEKTRHGFLCLCS